MNSGSMYVSFAGNSRCYLHIKGEEVSPIELQSPFRVFNAGDEELYRTTYGFLNINTINHRDNYPEAIVSHFESSRNEHALVLSFPTDYLDVQKTHLKSLRTATHEGFHAFAQTYKNRGANPSGYRAEMDETCYKGMLREEADALIGLARASFAKNRNLANSSFATYKKLRIERTKDRSFSLPFGNFSCETAENIMEQMEGITEYVSWSMLLKMNYGHTKEQFLKLITSELYHPNQEQNYYWTGAVLMFALEAFNPNAIKVHSAEWAENEGIWGKPIINVVDKVLR
jgi:hypothetical protein